jgi:hypothetical protein
VKIGIKTGDQAQIVSGLKPGEVVITEGAYGLPDKTRVRIEKPESAAAENGPSDKDNSGAVDQDTGNKAKANQDSGSKGMSRPAPAKKDNGKKD